jgi:YfiH family protein
MPRADAATWPVFDEFGLDALVTTRQGGVCEGPYASLNLGLHVGDNSKMVVGNRRRVAVALGAELGDFVFCEQTHGDRVHIVSDADRGRGSLSRDDAVPRTDALVTEVPGIVLVIMVADCLPVVLYDPTAHVLACVHAGWRGTVARVCQAAVAAMGTLGAKPGHVIAGLGPAVSAAGYQVGEEVAEAAERSLGAAAADAIRPDQNGKWLFDLPAANRIVLREAGLLDEHVSVMPATTGSAGGGLFFSDREARPCGRFAAVARLRPRPEGGDR